jgi:hypothetical protein
MWSTRHLKTGKFVYIEFPLTGAPMRTCILLCATLMLLGGCGSKQTVVKESPREPEPEPAKTVVDPVKVPPVALSKPAKSIEPEIRIAPSPAPDESVVRLKPPLAPAAATLRSGLDKRGAELRAGALLVADTTHIERWTFDTNGIWMHCRANAAFGGLKNALVLTGKTAQVCFSEKDQQALRSALEAAFNDHVSLDKQETSEGEHFNFRAENVSETQWVVSLRCRQKALQESVYAEFAPEYAANAKYRGESSDMATPSKRGEYTEKGKDMNLR